MVEDKAVLWSGIRIEALDITEEEKTQHEAKFAAWYANFRETHKDYFENREKNGVNEWD
jgi:hypothetical protein